MDLLPAEHRARVEHVASDFLSKPEDIADALKAKINSVDVVFFYSYLQPKPEPGKGAWSNAQELCDVNSALLANFLDALPIAGLKPPRILLQTGAKNYGVHLGRARTPYVESDPRGETELEDQTTDTSNLTNPHSYARAKFLLPTGRYSLEALRDKRCLMEYRHAGLDYWGRQQCKFDG